MSNFDFYLFIIALNYSVTALVSDASEGSSKNVRFLEKKHQKTSKPSFFKRFSIKTIMNRGVIGDHSPFFWKSHFFPPLFSEEFSEDLYYYYFFLRSPFFV